VDRSAAVADRRLRRLEIPEEMEKPDRLVATKDEYEKSGGERSNLRYGYVVRG
jgi:hypothetical protein